MNIKIKSVQIYEDHEDTIEEQYDNANINFLDKNVIVKYNKNEIIFDEKKKSVSVKREGNDIFIELNKENEFIYETPYGKINLKTYGERIEVLKYPFSMIIEYKITLNDTINYKNIMEILEF